ncbi:MAG: agmatinase [Candidatus Gracilibacteria bacterium]|jgi:agmatinase
MHFGDIPKPYTDYEKAKFVIIPVPYDGTSTWGKGSDKGPAAILEASANMELFDIESDCEPYRKGIFTDKPVTENSSPEKMVKAVEKITLKHLKNKKITVLLGGEHSVSIGAIKAHANTEKISVLQLDAHSDMRDEYLGSKNNHACIMARAKEICPVVQVGIRSMDTAEKKNINKKRVFFAHKIHGKTDWIKKAVSLLTNKVYLTIDLDVFDPSILPSTGTPEPGGLGWYEVLELIREVTKKKKIVGFDIVELAPNPNEKASDFLAAKLAYYVMSLV